MNIALIGYGKMGNQIEKCASAKNIHISAIFTSKNNIGGIGLTKNALKDVDVCIDFSTPISVLANIQAAAKCGKHVVVGTTGWYDKIRAVKKITEERHIGLVYSPNFSLGVNVFLQLVGSTAHHFDAFDLYDVAIDEIHHRGKADSPSGTALQIGQTVLQHLRSKKELLHEVPHEPVRPHQLQISSTRLGHTVGIHRVTFDSEADTIEMTHTAKNRCGFALGALVAAEWIFNRKGFFTMKDVLAS